MSKELLFRAHNSQDTPYIEYSAAEWESILYQKTRKPSYPKLLISILKGIPSHLRAEIWSYLTRLTLEPRFDFSLKEVPCNLVLKDACRTFPLDPNFKHPKSWGQKGLLKVLGAYSRYDSSFEYCQGMNYIAGFLLLIAEGEESEAFAVFQHLCLNGVSELFKQGFPLVFEMCRVFHESLSLSNQKLENYFQSNELDDNLWLIKWFLTLFVYSVKLEYATRIWDCVFARGLGFLVNVALGFVTNFKSQIKTKSPTEFLELINSFRSAEIDIEKVLAVADKTQLQHPGFLEAYVKENNTTENDKFNQH
mmetsp:Transcript_9982/g.14904  ORF Transcript_9982/g.14904 Transcript_9982/m.14904 type:complete len:307 (+) Transcript_9982:22-942(+)